MTLEDIVPSAHRLGVDEQGNGVYTPESARILEEKGLTYWADEDGLLHVEKGQT